LRNRVFARWLVRPDGFIAWRSEHVVRDPTAALRDALRQSLGHGPIG